MMMWSVKYLPAHILQLLHYWVDPQEWVDMLGQSGSQIHMEHQQSAKRQTIVKCLKKGQDL